MAGGQAVALGGMTFGVRLVRWPAPAPQAHPGPAGPPSTHGKKGGDAQGAARVGALALEAWGIISAGRLDLTIGSFVKRKRF